MNRNQTFFVVRGQDKPVNEEYVIATVIEHSKQVFKLTLSEYGDCEAQMLPKNICSSKWYSDIVKACPLRRNVVCQVVDDTAKIPMVVMSSVFPGKRDAVTQYWRQTKTAINYAKKCAKKTKTDLARSFNMLAQITLKQKNQMIEGAMHSVQRWKYLDNFRQDLADNRFSDIELAKLLLSQHQFVFNVNYHTSSFKIALVMHTPDGVQQLSQIFNQVLKLGGDKVDIEIWRNEPPVYHIKLSSLERTQLQIQDKIVKTIDGAFDSEDGELSVLD